MDIENEKKKTKAIKVDVDHIYIYSKIAILLSKILNLSIIFD